jgi:hypothetical protein
MNDDLEFAIKTYEDSHAIRVSPHEDGVWLGLAMSGCNAYTHMTKAEAQRLIDALTTIVEAA